MRHGHLISSLTLHDLTRVKKVLWHEGAEKRPRHERIESRALHARPAYQTAHSVSVIRHYQGAEQKTLREEWKSRAGCDFWRQWNMSRFGMQEKKLHAWWHQESEGSLFQKKKTEGKKRLAARHSIRVLLALFVFFRIP